MRTASPMTWTSSPMTGAPIPQTPTPVVECKTLVNSTECDAQYPACQWNEAREKCKEVELCATFDGRKARCGKQVSPSGEARCVYVAQLELCAEVSALTGASRAQGTPSTNVTETANPSTPVIPVPQGTASPMTWTSSPMTGAPIPQTPTPVVECKTLA